MTTYFPVSSMILTTAGLPATRLTKAMALSFAIFASVSVHPAVATQLTKLAKPSITRPASVATVRAVAAVSQRTSSERPVSQFARHASRVSADLSSLTAVLMLALLAMAGKAGALASRQRETG